MPSGVSHWTEASTFNAANFTSKSALGDAALFLTAAINYLAASFSFVFSSSFIPVESRIKNTGHALLGYDIAPSLGIFRISVQLFQFIFSRTAPHSKKEKISFLLRDQQMCDLAVICHSDIGFARGHPHQLFRLDDELAIFRNIDAAGTVGT